MKTAISIPDDVFNRAEYLAKKRGLKRSELYVMALEAYMEGGGEDVTDALDRVYGDGGEESSVDPAVESAALTDLPRDQW